MQRLLAATIICGMLVPPLAAQSYVNDFQAGLGNAAVYDDAALVAGRVALTPEAQATNGTLLVDTLGRVESFAASFDYRFTTGPSSSLSPGDGISFFLANVADGQFIGEDGVNNGLSVSFDLFEGAPLRSEVRLRINGGVVADIESNPISRTADSGFFRPITVSLAADGRVTVTYNGATLINDLPTAFAPDGANRFGFGARCGQANSEHSLDNVNITATIGVAGACCLDLKGSLFCVENELEADCISSGGIYVGDGTFCAEIDCNGGACCFSKGCAITDAVDCDEIFLGTYLGDATTCGPDSCLGACCDNQVCTLEVEDFCVFRLSATFGGVGSECATTCVGACCTPLGDCLEETEAACQAGGNEFQGIGIFCYAPGDSFCEAFAGACCLPAGGCILITDEYDCYIEAGDFRGFGVSCEDAECPGGCCLPGGMCIIEDAANCLANGGTYEGDGTTCKGVFCGPFFQGACCVLDAPPPLTGMCLIRTPAGCDDIGGLYLGNDTFCSAVGNVCPASGACCLGGSCSEDYEQLCLESGGNYLGDGVQCIEQCFDGACCLADGTCIIVSESTCAMSLGEFQGGGSSCETECPEPGTIELEPPTVFEAGGAADREVTADFDGDGDLDVAVIIETSTLGGAGGLQVFYNLGTAGPNWLGFQRGPVLPTAGIPTGIASAIFTGTRPDVAVSNGNGLIEIFVNDESNNNGDLLAGFVVHDAGPASFPSAIAAGPFIGGIAPDLAITLRELDTFRLLENTGGLTALLGGFDAGGDFTTQDGPDTICPEDIDNDRDVDLIIGSTSSRSVRVYNSSSNLQGPPYAFLDEVAIPGSPVDLTLGDIDGDTFLDIVTANEGVDGQTLGDSGTLTVVRNFGGKSFAFDSNIAVGPNPLAVEAVDLDLDGDPDLAVIATDAAVQVLENLRNSPNLGPVANFSTPVIFPVDATPNFVVSGDLDGDGRPDLVTANAEGPDSGSVTALLNETIPEFIDCNANGVQDYCDIILGDAEDCNANGIPDVCDTIPTADPMQSVAVDDCADAQLMSPQLVYSFDTTGFTNDGPGGCGIAVGFIDAWFRYVPSFDGLAQFSASTALPEYVVTVFDACPDDGGVALACSSAVSGAVLPVLSGATYYVRYAGSGVSVGSFDASMSGPPTVLNDLDFNGNGIPDACECPADVDGSGVVDAADLIAVMIAFGPCATMDCPEDVDGSGTVDDADQFLVMQNLEVVCPNLGPTPEPQTPFECGLDPFDNRSHD